MELSKFLLGSTAYLITIAAFPLTGCVAVWGEAHKVTSADANGIKVQYDSSLTGSARTVVLAKTHCKQFGKVAEPVSSEMPGLLLGIIEDTYICVTAPPANTASAIPADESPQKLRELQSLRKDGVITEDEFQNKKKQLLEKL